MTSWLKTGWTLPRPWIAQGCPSLSSRGFVPLHTGFLPPESSRLICHRPADVRIFDFGNRE